MRLDLRQVEDNTAFDADLCIVGTGAAGIAVARELAGSGLDICLIESGGEEFDDETQSLYEGDVVGRPYYDLDTTRLRYFGGTTNHWEGWCTPFDPLDFERRDWIPGSGWPVSGAELEPHYRRAARVCQLSRRRFGIEDWPELGTAPVNSAKLVHKIWQLSPPTRFAERYGSELMSSERVRVVFNANAREIVLGPGAAEVSAIRLATLDGRSAIVRARAYVLACGAIETPRLMLASTATETRGVGNTGGLVGRYFMEHPHIPVAEVVASRALLGLGGYRSAEHDGIEVFAGLGPSVAAQRRLGILNSSLTLDPILGGEGYRSLRDIYHRLKGARPTDEFGNQVWTVLKDLDGAAVDLYDKLVNGQPERLAGFMLYARSEQAPDPESRITLTRRRDRLGMPRVALDWRLSEIDKRTIGATARLAAEELGRLGLGRVRLYDWLLSGADDWGAHLSGGHHQMGTTRMSATQATGVVDADCRVHGKSNLYIAGSSVFPTGSFANPTLTIVALALRLADHLGNRLAA